MNDPSATAEPKDPRVEAALREYLERTDRGETVDRETFIAAHPEIACELRSFIAAEQEVKRLGGVAFSREPAADSTRSFSHRGQETVVPRAMAQRPPESSGTGLAGQFGRYRIVRVLGQGAMGTVYLAEDTQLQRQVALKSPHFTDSPTEDVLERFYREARAAATLRHPNICPVYDFGQIDGKHYISMAYIEGRPLSSSIRPDNPQSERQILIAIRKLAQALQEAHDHGIVHRDLKPANVMVDKRGEPIIMDFGLARQTRRQGDIRLTQSGMLIGSPAYMSPEQVEGEHDKIGPPTDQYSLGVILYELLTGQLPFRGSMAAVMGQIITKVPALPSQLRPDVDPRIEAVCLRMMAKRASDRYSSLTVVTEELATILRKPAAKPLSKEKPAAAMSSSPADRPSGTKSSASQVAESMGAKAVTQSDVLSLEELARKCLARHDYEQVIQIIERIPEQRRTPGAEELLKKARDHVDAIAFLICEIDEAVHLNDRLAALKKAEELRKIKPGHHRARQIQEEFRGYGTGGAARIGRLRQFTQPWNEGGWIPWSVLAFGLAVFGVMLFGITIYLRSGNTVVKVVIDDPNVNVNVKGSTLTLKGPTRQELKVEPGEQELTITYAGLQVSTKSFTLKKGQKTIVTVSIVDSSIVAKLENETLPLTPSLGGQENKVAREGAGAVQEKKEVVQERAGKIHEKNSNVARAETPDIPPEPLKLKPGEPVSGMALVRKPKPLPGLRSWTIETVANRERATYAFRPDGRQLATGVLDGTIRIWEPGKDRPLRVLLGHDEGEIFAAWSPEGKYLASCATDRTLRFWDPVAGRLLRTITTPGVGRAIAWSPNGLVVASGGWGGYAVRLWDVASGREGRVFPSPGKDASPTVLTWSSDGKLLACLWSSPASRAMVWDVASGQILHNWSPNDDGPAGSSGGGSSIVFAPDGRWLAATTGNKRAQIWDLPSGKRVAKLDHSEWVTALGWSPNGPALISCCYDGNARYWDPSSGKLLATVPVRTGSHGVLSPGGNILASGDGWHNLYIHDLKIQSRETVPGTDASSRHAAWSPDGDRLALTHYGGTSIWEADSGRVLRRLTDSRQEKTDIAWSPTGKALAVASLYKETVQLWNPDTGDKLATLMGSAEGVNAVAWSRDGNLLAAGGPDKTVRTWQAATGEPLHTFKGHTDRILAVAWSADGQTVASASADQTIRLWNPATGNPRRVLKEHKGTVTNLAWSPDGKSLVSSGEDRTTIWWNPATGGVRHKVDYAYGPLAWAPDGQTLASGWGVRLLNGKTAEFLRELKPLPNPGGIDDLTFSPDGKTLLALGGTGVQVLDVASGLPHGVLLGMPKEGHLAIQADGHWRGSPGIEKQLLYIAVTNAGQETLTPEEFSRKYGWKNDPDKVRLLGK